MCDKTMQDDKMFCSTEPRVQDPDNNSVCVCVSRGGAQAELEIVVELGNLVPRKNLVSQKVSLDLRNLQS